MELKRIPKNTVTTTGEHWCQLKNANRLVYPKSTQDEAHFPFIESIAISHSTSYTTTGWHPLQQSRDSLRHPSQVNRNINFSKATGWNIRAPHIVWIWELIPCCYWRGKPSFHKHLKRSFPLGICMWQGPCVLCFKRNGPRDALIRKKFKFPCRGFMHAHRSYHKMKGCLSPL